MHILAPRARAAAAAGGLAALSLESRWRSRTGVACAEPHQSPTFVARAVDHPHAPLGRVPGNGEKFAVSELGYVVLKEAGWLYPPFGGDKGMPAQGNKLQEFRESVKLRGGQGGDIVVATYPKCGTTWMQQIILLLEAGGDKEKIKGWFESGTITRWIEMEFDGAAAVNAWEPQSGFARRLWKTHSSAKEAPWAGGPTTRGIPEGAKVVVVTRNPGDAAVSMFHHATARSYPLPGLVGFRYTGSLSHFVDQVWLHGNVESGDFWAWHASWWRAKEELPNDRLLIVSYEDMIADLPHAIRTVASFCDLPHDDALVARVVEASGFSAMKDQFDAQIVAAKAEGKKFKPDHIRKGGKGGWRTALSPELAAHLPGWHAQRCAEEGLPPDFFCL